MSDYTDSGFDGFLSRSIDNLTQVTLDSQGPVSTSQRYDSTQVSGSLGDTLQIGSVFLNGSDESIELIKDRNKPLLVGKDSKGNQVVKVAKDGYDAKTARDDQLIFNSGQNVLKIVKEGVGSVSSPGDPTNWATINHNLGFVPIPLVFLDNVNLTPVAQAANIPLPTYGGLSVDTVNHVVNFTSWLHPVTDINNLYVVMFNSLGTAKTLNFKYYLLQESAV